MFATQFHYDLACRQYLYQGHILEPKQDTWKMVCQNPEFYNGRWKELKSCSTHARTMPINPRGVPIPDTS